MKTARGNQEQVSYTSKPKTGREVVQWPWTPCYWCTGSHQQPRQQHCAANGKRCNKGGVIGHFSCACKSRASHQISSKASRAKRLLRWMARRQRAPTLVVEGNSLPIFTWYTVARQKLHKHSLILHLHAVLCLKVCYDSCFPELRL